MVNESTSITMPASQDQRWSAKPEAALLLAFAPTSTAPTDRVVVRDSLLLGRSSSCDLQLRDAKISKQHARLRVSHDIATIEDLKSTNGTFVNGSLLVGTARLETEDVIRVGDAVFVWYSNASHLLTPAPAERHGMLGRFFAGALLRTLKEAALSSRHVLLVGPTGSGKELAAAALSRMCGAPKFVTHNCARFSSEEEASATLFGVAARVFSGVDARSGLIEEAAGGMLFLDEVHNLPVRVQRSLLRIMETGEYARIGESKTRQVSVRFVLAANAPAPDYGLADDILARLRVVELPPLSQRRADIPSLLLGILPGRMERQGLHPTLATDLITADHMESLCLHGLQRTNVRGLIDIADRIATAIQAGAAPSQAIDAAFEQQLEGLFPPRHGSASPSLVPQSKPMLDTDTRNRSHYEEHKQAILAAVSECNGNLAAAERLLHTRGIRSSRRWLSHFVRLWSK